MSEDRSAGSFRVVEVRDRVVPAAGKTVIEEPDPGRCGELFVRHYRDIVDAVRDSPALSVVVVALDEVGIAARAVLPAVPSHPQHATVGRHERAEVSLGGDPALALRHLLVLVEPLGERLRYRVLDLRTEAGMCDEHGARLDAFDADEPALVQVGRHVILFVPRNHPALGWSTDPRVAWRNLPQARVRETRHVPAAPADPHRTVLETPSLEVLGQVSLLAELPESAVDGLVVALLEIDSPGGALRKAIGRKHARSGVLLGRYERCDGTGSGVMDQPAVSRVHAVLVAVGRQMYVVDLGSSNGTWIGDKKVGLRAVTSGEEIRLGRHGAVARWISP
ncbi:MAG: FHA domain-containing protein [Myxococcota bacterium]